MATSNRGRKGRPAPAIVETGADTRTHLPGKRRYVRYTDAIANEILGRIAAGESLRSILRDETMPGYVTVYAWLRERPGFAALYDQARQDQADTLVLLSALIRSENPD
jgi:hypothetical protein